MMDIVFGTCATFISGVWMYNLKGLTFKDLPLLSLLMPAVFNGIIVGLELALIFNESDLIVYWLIYGFQVFVGELAVLLVVGTAVYLALKRLSLMDNSYFLQELQNLLNQQEFDAFIRSFSNPLYRSLRINRLKADYHKISEEIELKGKTLFDEDTYYIDSEDRLGKHPYHLAGLFYLQEPSATMAVNALNLEEGDWVLDLCAAPGGKSTQILSKLNRTGFLLSNEYDRKRANTLLSNIERFGCDNYLITNNKVADLCVNLLSVFDKVLVDAPCSGAGMFKKYPDSLTEYNHNTVMANQKRQLQILDYAYLALKEGGILVYSTCTFNSYENEEVVRLFLEKYPDMQLIDTGLNCGQAGFDEKV